MIHCIGDSHVCFFSGKDKICDDPYLEFRPHRIGAYLAYNLGDPNHDAFKKLMSAVSALPREDQILLSFGEIDIRVHVVKQAEKQQRSIKEIVDEIVGRYVAALRILLNDNRKVIVWCPVPTCNHYNPEAAVSEKNPYPHIGTTQQRNEANLNFLSALSKTVGAETNVCTLHLYNDLLNEDMTSKGDYFMDGVHLSQKAMPIVLDLFKTLRIIT